MSWFLHNWHFLIKSSLIAEIGYDIHILILINMQKHNASTENIFTELYYFTYSPKANLMNDS